MAHQQNSGDFYTKLEKHIIRILLVILLLFAAYKVIIVEFPRDHLPCGSVVPNDSKQHNFGTLPNLKALSAP